MAAVVHCRLGSPADRRLQREYQLVGAYSLAGARSQLRAYQRISADYVAMPLVSGLDFAAEHKLTVVPHRGATEIKVTGATITPRPYQASAFAELRRQLNDQEPGLMAVLPPGWGKTIFGAAAIAQVKYRTLIVFGIQALQPSWLTVIQRCLPNLRVWVVGETEPDEDADVIICMDTRVGKIPGHVLQSIGFLIVDEGHMFCSPTRADLLLRIPVVRLLILTGTPKRADGLDSFLDLLTGGNQIVRDPPPYTVYKVNTGRSYEVKTKEMFDRRSGQARETRDFTAFVRDVAADPDRMAILVDLIVNFLPDSKIIVLCRSMAQCRGLHKALVEAKVSCDFMAGTKKKYADSRVLVGTGSKIGTGFDEANACEDFGGLVSDELIIADSIKNEATLLQWIGRVLRSEQPRVWQLVDDHPIAAAHWKRNLKMYIQQNQTVEECDYPADFYPEDVEREGEIFAPTEGKITSSLPRAPGGPIRSSDMVERKAPARPATTERKQQAPACPVTGSLPRAPGGPVSLAHAHVLPADKVAQNADFF